MQILGEVHPTRRQSRKIRGEPLDDVAGGVRAVVDYDVELVGVRGDGRKVKHYYVPESVGIASGLLIASLHNAGLATLTHTPSPMGFLNEACGRPDNEKPLMLVVAGYPADNAAVPDIRRKGEDEVIVWRE